MSDLDGRTVRRVVTGHDGRGVSVVVDDGPPPIFYRREAGGAIFHEVWQTPTTPAPLSAREDEPTDESRSVPPTAVGTAVRIIDFPASDVDGGRPSPMHRTETVDYGLVLEGEMVLILDDSEVVLRTGDVVVQRGTDHAWVNRSSSPARMVFVLVDGTFTPDLAASIGPDALAAVMPRRVAGGMSGGGGVVGSGPAIRRMPVAFGPQPGPRQRPGGGRWATPDRGRTLSLSVRVPVDAGLLDSLLPGPLSLDGHEATVTVTELSDLPWLAGRGYNLAMVTVPVVHHGDEMVHGDFELVTWESLADPILSGREELGFNKVYGDVSAISVSDDGRRATASVAWDGFTFLRVGATQLTDDSGEPAPAPAPLLHHRYLPASGDWGATTVDCFTGGGWEPSPDIRLVGRRRGDASLHLEAGTFEVLPTLCHITSVLARLPTGPASSAVLTQTTGYTDLYDNRVLR